MEDNKNDISNEELNDNQHHSNELEEDSSIDSNENRVEVPVENKFTEDVDFEELDTEKQCYNCGASMILDAKFCSNCGQKYTTGKIPVSTFIFNFFKNTFNIDSKLPKTLVNLLIFPGRLTKEFFKGRHQSYLKPVKLFVFMTILCFTIIAFKTGDFGSKFSDEEDESFRVNIEFNESENEMYFLKGLDSAKIVTDSLLQLVKKESPTSQFNSIIDTIFQPWLKEQPFLDDSLTLPKSLRPGDEQIVIVAKKDLMLKPDKALLAMYNIDGFWEKILFSQVLKTIKHEDELIQYFLGYSSWTFFLLVPLFALILKIVYIRRKHFYVEHLVFTLHFHAFLFTIFSVTLLLNDFTTFWIQLILLLYIPIHLLISMKVVYQQSLFKTIIKYIMLIISYIFVFTVALIITMAIAFLLF